MFFFVWIERQAKKRNRQGDLSVATFQTPSCLTGCMYIIPSLSVSLLLRLASVSKVPLN